ncbi:GTPase [Treponema endosymbiont of Eucomonympha sp.]|uniref:GTPase n=1 Tax=Treponema endosymbiont of Eucomonympha sp. TaxID=1580831 RepID=UPI0013968479|nr:GTPase [Treponema endosymbiont of Eucomonympha sp.]
MAGRKSCEKTKKLSEENTMGIDFSKIGILVNSLLEKRNFDERVEKEREKMANLNIINIGKTGVGKSTIINAVFCKDLAKTGIGKPVTQHCHAYSIPDSPITIYDSKGIETGKDNTAILGEIYDKIKNQNSSPNTNGYIHICWYCVLDDGNRLDENEVEIIKKIKIIIPVIIVITQSVGGNKTNEFINEIKKDFNNNYIDIIPVMAVPKIEESDFGQMNIKTHGLDKLVERSYDLLPESVQKTFAAYQNTSVQLKSKYAVTATVFYSGAVAIAALQPAPIADAPIMIAIQIGMMANITACFGIRSSNFNFKTVLSGVGGPFAAAVVGRTFVSLLKLIPVLGTIAGGAINATTGAVITFAIGSLYIKVLSSLIKGNGKINEAEIIDALNKAAKNINMDEMKKEWEENKDNYSKSESQRILEEAKRDI